MSVPLRSVLVLLAWIVVAAPARAGHEFPFYPSFYPQEIQIVAVEPPSAAEQLQKGSLHAYVGGDPFGERVPPNVGHVEFLGSYVVVTVNTGRFADKEARCAAARRAMERIATGSYTFHPYPVTPYHADFLQHFDLAEAAKKEYPSRAAGGASLRIRAKGDLAKKLVRSETQTDDTAWDATVEAIDAHDLMSSRGVSLNGWLGPPWIKEGWFHAYLLLGGTVTDREAKQLIDTVVRRLSGSYDSPVERLNLERRLVSLLRSGCERVVAGYTVKREHFNAEYSGGVENIGHDALAGFNSAVFIRTVKLKDFPWNGWLTLGVPTVASAAWNPIGGFTDGAGRLMWFALGDPALFPSPFSGSWVSNRVTASLVDPGSPPGGVTVPEDALIPDPGTGLFRKVGPGARAAAQVHYRVLTSAFHDGTRMSPGDVIYPFAFAFRWGSKAGEREYDPVVDASTALLRGRLAGLKLLRVERDVLAFGDMKLTYEVPVFDVYVNYRLPDPLQVAALAPPWSSLPWHVIALMEEAATRGVAAFSQQDAKRRSIAWMDLARDQKLKEALASLVEELGARSYVPEALKGFVSGGEARERWNALKRFYAESQHFLVTNGPYRLHQWSESSVVLRVFRDLSFPRGVGSFDRYAIPLRAYISKTELRGDRLEISAEVEKVERFGREYKIVTEPFSKRASEQDKRSLPVCRYVIVSPDGTVANAGTVPPTGAGTFVIPLKEKRTPGPHTILVALDLDGNHVKQLIKVVPWTP